MLGDLGYVQKHSSKPRLYNAHIEYVPLLSQPLVEKFLIWMHSLSRETSKTFYCFMKFLQTQL